MARSMPPHRLVIPAKIQTYLTRIARGTISNEKPPDSYRFLYELSLEL